jgi:hypothetical protein
MSTAPPPPWQGKAPEPELAPDGRPIRRTRFGAFVQRADGLWESYTPAEQEFARLFGKRRRTGPIVAGTDFDPFFPLPGE